MELIQIDSVKKVFTDTTYVSPYHPLPDVLFVDTETGVVYFNGQYPRYDSNGRIMVIPKDRLPDIIARAKAQAATLVAESQRNHSIQV